MSHEGSGDAAADPPVPDLEDRAQLDSALSPLRRLLVYSRTPPAPGEPAARHLEPNALRWLDRAMRVADPDDRRALDGLRVYLRGVDSAPDRGHRLDVLFQELTRFDAIRGLPLPPAARPERIVGVAPAPVAAPPPARPAQPAGGRPGSRPSGPPPAQRRGSDVTLESRLDAFLPPALGEALAAIGLEVFGDLAALAPEAEEVLTPVYGAGRPVPPGRAALGGRVRRRWSVARPDGETQHFVTLQGADLAQLRWRTTPAVLRRATLAALLPEARVVVVGDWADDALHEPELAHLPSGAESTAEGTEDRRSVRLLQYAGVDGRLVRAAILALAAPLGKLRENLPPELVTGAGLLSPGEAVAGVHLRAAPEGRRRFAYEEALLLQIGLSWPRFASARERGIAHPLQHGLLARLAPQLGLALSDAQAVAFEDVKRDLRRPLPGMRVLSGPTDSASTVAFHAALLVAESRAQVLVVCADAIGAEEKLTRFEHLFQEAGLVARALVGEPSRAAREALRRGEIHLVFAGADILGHALEWRRLGLVIAFEAAPYGALARRLLADARAGRPDVLVVPGEDLAWATMLRAWPLFDRTVVGSSAPLVHLEVAPASTRAAVYARAAARTPRDQVLVTFPLVGGTDALDLRDALRLVRALEGDAFQQKRVALYHGSMAREDRARVADDVLHRRVDVVVATTRFEDGGPLGRISAVLVEQAGSEDPNRVRRLMALPRGGGSWVALILGDDAAAPAWMAALAGPRSDLGGDPAPQLRWAAGEDALGWQARRAAHELLAEDPGLRRSPDLARQVRDRWEDWFPHADESSELDPGDEPLDEEGAWPCPIPETSAAPGDKKRRRRRKKKK